MMFRAILITANNTKKEIRNKSDLKQIDLKNTV